MHRILARAYITRRTCAPCARTHSHRSIVGIGTENAAALMKEIRDIPFRVQSSSPVQLATAAEVGATQVRVAQPVAWAPGGQLVVASSSTGAGVHTPPVSSGLAGACLLPVPVLESEQVC